MNKLAFEYWESHELFKEKLPTISELDKLAVEEGFVEEADDPDSARHKPEPSQCEDESVGCPLTVWSGTPPIVLALRTGPKSISMGLGL